jgi:nucleoside-diphosphate-sugar epimerase
MKVLVTGGGGFLGFAIVQLLVQEGYEVVTYSRGSYDALAKLGVTQFQGTLSDYEQLCSAIQGCEAVFHVAAKTGFGGTYDSFHEVNVIGTSNILRACRKYHMHYLIYTSSASVVFDRGSGGIDEHQPYPKIFEAFYPQTKAIAEESVLYASGPELVTCSLRPHLIWGPGDPHYLPKLNDRQQKGKLYLPGKGANLVDHTYIDNAAAAHLQVLEMMQKNPAVVSGKAYFITQDEPMAIRTFIDRLLDCGGLPPISKSIHPRVALLAGWLVQTLFKWFRLNSEPPVTVFLVKQFLMSHWFDISAAKRDFGYIPKVSTEEGMMRLKAWFNTK